jgi:hypothetical protein
MADYITSAILIAQDREHKLGHSAIKKITHMFSSPKVYTIAQKHRMAYLYNEGCVCRFDIIISCFSLFPFQYLATVFTFRRSRKNSQSRKRNRPSRRSRVNETYKGSLNQ